jgi:murein DD-endopeptidase MepM/ murein hydrolase activator NlpD
LTYCFQEHHQRPQEMNNNAKTYTVLIIPNRNGGKTLSICLSKAVIFLLATFVFLSAGAASVILFKSASAARKLQYFNALRRDNEFLIKENNQLRQINNKIIKIDSISEYLERLSAVSQPTEKMKSGSKTAESRRQETVADTVKTITGGRSILNKSEEREKQTEPDIKSQPMALPVEGWITQQFIDDTTPGVATHPGIDIAAAEGMIIKAPAPGTVLSVETDQYYGNLIVIKHNEEFTTRYGHCAKAFVSKGEKIERGQPIALVGNTGHSTAPHLHYEVIRNGKNINPLQFTSTGNK